jgi:hypothetical protein
MQVLERTLPELSVTVPERTGGERDFVCAVWSAARS